MTDATSSVSRKQPFEEHPALAEAIKAVYEGGVNLIRWNDLLTEINTALTVERNEAYVRGMHDEHNDPLGDHLPPLPLPRAIQDQTP